MEEMYKMSLRSLTIPENKGSYPRLLVAVV